MQLTLDGKGKDDIAIERLQEFEPPEGYVLKFSGGKDSVTLLHLAERSGVRFEAVYNMELDPPEHVHWMRSTYGDRVRFNPPTISMWQLIKANGYPPTRKTRYCCRYFKERSDPGRVVLTGVRWDESARRSKRRMTEGCTQGSGTLVHPLIDWTDDDVWDYIHTHAIPYSPLYDEGFKRVGCIMCPMTNPKQQRREAERWPKIAAAFRRSCQRALDIRTQRGLGNVFESGDEMYEVWLGMREAPHRDAPQEPTRYCACGCGEQLPERNGTRQRKWLNDEHKMNAWHRAHPHTPIND